MALSLIGTGVFVFIPFLDVVRRSFFDGLGKKAVGLKNYRMVLENEAFIMAVKNTGWFLLICIPLLMLLSLGLGLLASGEKKDTVKTCLLVPFAVPAASMALIWKVMFHRQGLVNTWLGGPGQSSVDWLNGQTAFGVLVCIYIWKNAGYNMVLWLTGLKRIPAQYYEAARTDGAGKWQCFYYITLPSLKPFVPMILLISFVNSFKVFREAYLLSGDYPHNSIYMLQHVFNNWFANMDIQKMCAGAVLLVLVFAAVMIPGERRRKE